MLFHSIPPFYNKNSKILILGSFPSVKSREAMFFYGHPQNRFWKVLAKVFGCDVPQTLSEKKDFLTLNQIAVWDVINSCEITGSSDNSIKNITANDIHIILDKCDIKQIFVNGRTAEKLYNKHIKPVIKRDGIYLPSTSPANATWSVDRLVDEWMKVGF